MKHGNANQSADFVIVGGGSAGCVLANRLSKTADCDVILLETGSADRLWAWTIHMPGAYGINFIGGPYTHPFHSEPQVNLGGRSIYQPRGKVLGGSSSINGMVYVRGNPLDYERWVREGAVGWSYEDVLPYFRRLEGFSGGGNKYRGDSGPVRVAQGTGKSPLYDAFICAGMQAGYPRTEDVNGSQQEGFARADRNTSHGIRSGASWSYLRPIRKRRNLSVRTRVIVTRILFERGKAIGVEYLQDEELRKLYTRREIILAAGAFGSPQVLLRSGIGAPSALKAFNIPVVADLPGVGQNLRDHLEFYTSWTCPKEASINSHMTRWGKMRIGLQWLLTRRGLGDSNHCEGIAFVKSGPSAIYCDIELQFMPIQISLGSVPKSSPSGFSICVSHQRPESVGTVALRSLDPRVSPMINPSYLSTDHDRRQARRCIEVVREVVSQRAFDPFRGQELTPGPSIASAAEIDAFCKATGTSGYHPVGTCKMGPETDRSSVVAPNGLVHGVSNLRVVDASIFPSLPTGNTNAPVMMVAEKISDVILDS